MTEESKIKNAGRVAWGKKLAKMSKELNDEKLKRIIEEYINSLKDDNEIIEENTSENPFVDILDITCTICLNKFDKPINLHCGHTFCYKCIKGCADNDLNACSICREPFDPTQIDTFSTNYVAASLTNIQIQNIEEECKKNIHRFVYLKQEQQIKKEELQLFEIKEKIAEKKLEVDRKIEEYTKLQTANNKTFEKRVKKQTIENNLLLLKCFFDYCNRKCFLDRLYNVSQNTIIEGCVQALYTIFDESHIQGSYSFRFSYPWYHMYSDPTRFIIEMFRLDDLSKEEYGEYAKLFRCVYNNINATMEIVNGLFKNTHTL
jgi:hypothetical protein